MEAFASQSTVCAEEIERNQVSCRLANCRVAATPASRTNLSACADRPGIQPPSNASQICR